MVVTVAEQDIRIAQQRDELAINDKLGSIPREIIIRGQGLLSVASTPDIDLWLAGGNNSSRIANLEKSHLMVLLSLILVPAFLYVFLNL
ncbi:hypothetical protein RS130_22565 [Paraglaciecola aquimarina]|uniref:Uncharacterized protein n=1 Tax=Paraglaciecola aquimarina TaxID=1235557 RepID=A0ABU3T208_9ALTE|nr:hypothetical protein [Paraglaciecola aquimarina]MDU0356298.1 hypothetical protein [Paraglaciecola aquimarina]